MSFYAKYWLGPATMFGIHLSLAWVRLTDSQF